MSKRVTIKDIAREAGVSHSTVSRALARDPRISDATRERIIRIAQTLGYERNELARALIRGALKAIGIVIPDITNPFLAEIARGVSNAADQEGYGLVVCNTDRKEEKELEAIQLLRRMRVPGLILASIGSNPPYLDMLKKLDTPYILVSRICPALDASYVVIDDENGARIATEHLVSLGHKHIAFIGGSPDLKTTQDRVRGYKKALSKYGLPENPNWICLTGSTQAAGREAARQILLNSPRPTAILAENDITAIGVMETADAIGLAIPRDLSLVGFDDISYSSLPRIQLTTVAQPAVEMGQAAAKWLIEAIENRSHSELHLVLPPRLVVRASTAAPPPNKRSSSFREKKSQGPQKPR